VKPFSQMSLHEMKHLLETRQLSAVELVEAAVSQAEQHREINAFVTETFDEARELAIASDSRRKAGDARKLEGLPLAIKDNFCTKGVRTTAGSKILGNFIPTYESFVTNRLFENGALMVGKTNMDEFGMGSSTENSPFGPTLNPRALELGLEDYVAGGSSGGSAAAVAAGFCVGGVGTDTGGSIRQPAAFCGVVGMKPTYGLCSRRGIIAYASSLDQAGVIANSVRDVATLLEVMVGHDELDTTSLDCPDIDLSIEGKGRSFRVGIVKQFRTRKFSDDLERAWTTAEKCLGLCGIELVEIDLPHVLYSLPAYYVIAASESSSNLSRYDGVRYGYRAVGAFETVDEMMAATRTEGFGIETRNRILLGTFALSAGYYDAYYDKARRVRHVILDEFRAAFEKVDAIAWPTAPTAAFKIGAHDKDPVSLYLEDIFTVPVNLAGLPAISLPVSTSALGLPMGIQIIGPQLGDGTVLKIAHRMEAVIAGSLAEDV
jgi:aspartyl-tRNA(Asn)/glutamyl-tRNA(Gln) amidotransferase subunit A